MYTGAIAMWYNIIIYYIGTYIKVWDIFNYDYYAIIIVLCVHGCMNNSLVCIIAYSASSDEQREWIAHRMGVIT